MKTKLSLLLAYALLALLAPARARLVIERVDREVCVRALFCLAT